MKKLLFALTLCTLVITLALSATAETYSGYCGGEGDGTNLTWTLDTSTGVLEIDGTGKMKDYWSSYSSVPWYSYRSSVKSVTLGDGVTSISNDAFYNYDALTSVDMPNVTSIGSDAFANCSSLTSVEIPACTTSIDSGAFRYCNSLESITVDDANTKYSSDNLGVLFDKDKSTLVQYPIGNSRTSYSLPSTVTSIGNSAFSSCDAITSVEMPNVTSIGYEAFNNCDALTSADMPNVTTIGSHAFAYCDAITSVEIPACTKSVGFGAFNGCSNLKKATIYSKTVTFSGSYVFDDTHATFEIHGYIGSTAETYANNNNIPFYEIEDNKISFNTIFNIATLLGSEMLINGTETEDGGFISGSDFMVTLKSDEYTTADLTYTVDDESIFEVIEAVDGPAKNTQFVAIKTHKIGTTKLTVSLPNGKSKSIHVTIIRGNYIELSEKYDTDYLYCNGAFLNSENELSTTPEFYVSIKNAARTGSVGDNEGENTLHNVKLKATVSGSNMSFEKGSYKNTYESCIPELKLNEALADLLLLYPYNVNENTFKSEKTFTVSIEISCDELTETYTDTMSFDVKNYKSSLEIHLDFINNSGAYQDLKFNNANDMTDRLLSSFDYNWNNIVFRIASIEGVVEELILDNTSDLVVADVLSSFLSSPMLEEFGMDVLIRDFAGNHEAVLTEANSIMSDASDIWSTLPGYIDNMVLDEYVDVDMQLKPHAFDKLMKVSKYKDSETKFKDQDLFTHIIDKFGKTPQARNRLNNTFAAIDKTGQVMSILSVTSDLTNDMIKAINIASVLNAYHDADVYKRGIIGVLYSEMCKLNEEFPGLYSDGLMEAVERYVSTESDFGYIASHIKTISSQAASSAFHLYSAILGEQTKAYLWNVFGSIPLKSGGTIATNVATTNFAAALAGWQAGKCVSNILCNSSDWASEMAKTVELGYLSLAAHRVLLLAENELRTNQGEENIKIFETSLALYKVIQSQALDHVMEANKTRASSIVAKIFTNFENDVVVANNELANLKKYYEGVNCHGDYLDQVRSLSPATESVKIIQIACPVNVFVYDSDGSLLAQIENDEILFEAPGVVVSVFNDVKFIIVPADEEFTVEIVATDDGKMNYSVSEYNEGELVRVVNYSDIDLYNAQEFNGNINSGYDISAQEYNLSTTNKSGQPTSIDDLEVLTQSSLNSLSVEVTCEGSGSATGVDSATKGDYVVVVAVPDDGYKFKGWFNGNKCVSKEEAYGFNIESDIVLTAKFSTLGITPGDADGNDDITIRDAALILQYIAGWNVEINTDAADADGNGTITIRDAALILQYIAGWDVELG